MAKKEKIGYKPLDTAYTRDIDAWFIIVMIVFFFPIGIWLMWTRTSWKKWLKITVTSIVAALFLVRFVANAVQVYNAQQNAPDGETTAIVETLEEP